MKNLAKVAVIVVLVLLGLFVFNNNKETVIEVSIENNSGLTSTDFFLYFPNATTPQSVPNIEANDTYVTTMKYEESQESDSLRIFYYTNDGEKIDFPLIKSFKKGYKASLMIDIVDVHENGVYNLATTIK